jgi:endogenous inhibitor of DNA gyrase (YacG/DUF329 family)
VILIMIKTRCPACESEMTGPDRSAWPDYPFCSSRCRLIDLGRWLGGSYRIAADPEEDGSASKLPDDSSLE